MNSMYKNRFSSLMFCVLPLCLSSLVWQASLLAEEEYNAEENVSLANPVAIEQEASASDTLLPKEEKSFSMPEAFLVEDKKNLSVEDAILNENIEENLSLANPVATEQQASAPDTLLSEEETSLSMPKVLLADDRKSFSIEDSILNENDEQLEQEKTEPLVKQEKLPEEPSSQTVANPSSIFQTIAPKIELHMGYFFFTDSTLRDVYDKGGLDLQLAGSYPVWKGLQVYGSVGYTEKSGRSLNDYQKTSIYQIPVQVGLRPVFTLCKELQYYFTFGPRYFFIHQHNESSYVKRNQGSSEIGFFANSGINFKPIEHFFIDIFGEYSFGKTHFHAAEGSYSRNIQVSGLSFGFGAGYEF